MPRLVIATDHQRPRSRSLRTPDAPARPAAVRRLAERVAALAALVLAAPLIGLLWAVVRLTSRGPGFFTQRRVGLHGREFYLIKLRTMTHDCERATGAVWARPNDPRVTPVGAFLRATHLDELPQLVNVVRGEMCLVGPRPERPEIIERLLPEIPNYLDRLAVTPGVTGLAQIFAPADLTIEDVRRKLHFDLLYIRDANLWLDVRVACCTFFKMLGIGKRRSRRLFFPRLSRETAAAAAQVSTARPELQAAGQ